MKPLTLQTTVPFWVMGHAAVLISMIVLTWQQGGPSLVINETPSEPRGIYRVVTHGDPTDYRRGMYVIFPVPESLKAIVYGRGWLKSGIPFLKELLGLAGDEVCVVDQRLEVNHQPIGPVFVVDSRGLALPQRTGCFQVPAGYFFAASQHFEKSFDGRYFGALPLSDLTGEARPVWTF